MGGWSPAGNGRLRRGGPLYISHPSGAGSRPLRHGHGSRGRSSGGSEPHPPTCCARTDLRGHGRPGSSVRPPRDPGGTSPARPPRSAPSSSRSGYTLRMGTWSLRSLGSRSSRAAGKTGDRLRGSAFLFSGEPPRLFASHRFLIGGTTRTSGSSYAGRSRTDSRGRAHPSIRTGRPQDPCVGDRAAHRPRSSRASSSSDSGLSRFSLARRDGRHPSRSPRTPRGACAQSTRPPGTKPPWTSHPSMVGRRGIVEGRGRSPGAHDPKGSGALLPPFEARPLSTPEGGGEPRPGSIRVRSFHLPTEPLRPTGRGSPQRVSDLRRGLPFPTGSRPGTQAEARPLSSLPGRGVGSVVPDPGATTRSSGVRSMRKEKRRRVRRLLRPLGAPTPLQVWTNGRGKPATVLQGSRKLQVVSIRSMWRIDDEWWRIPISRWYFDLILEDGRLLTVYRDLRERRWYVQPGG